MSQTRDRIAEYYRSKSAASFRLRLLVIFPSIVLFIFLFTRIFFTPLTVTDDAMAPSVKPGETVWVHVLAAGFRKPFSMNSPSGRFGNHPKVTRGMVVAMTPPALSPSSRFANIFRFGLEFFTLGFYKPENSRLVVRRVVGLPGESILIRDRQIFINNQRYIPTWNIDFGEPLILPARISGRDQMAELYIPADSVFVLGDHWMSENDSRSIGPVPTYKIHGNLPNR